MNSIFKNNLLSGKKILITGASSGIGLESARLMHDLGADLVVSGRNVAKLELIQREFNYERCTISPADLSGFDAAQSWASKLINENGPLDGFFHSAGVALIKPLRLLKANDCDDVFGSSILAALGVISILAKKGSINPHGGSLLFMSSVSSLVGRQGLSLYSASKSAINGLVRSTSIELASRLIRVNAIAAGAINTEMHANIVQTNTSQMMSDYEKLHPLGFGQSIDVANMVAYMMSDASKWITGSVIALDGGYAAQ